MVESLQTSAQLTTVVEVDVTAISRLRDAAKADFAAREGVKLSYLPFFAKAAIDALKQHPTLNATIDTEKGEVTYYDRENLGDRGRHREGPAHPGDQGRRRPVDRRAGPQDRRRRRAHPHQQDHARRARPAARSRSPTPAAAGALFDTPIINQPQVAILGTGAVVKRPVVIDDANLGETIAVRQMVYLALTYDHRLVDGADAARFLTDVKGAARVRPVRPLTERDRCASSSPGPQGSSAATSTDGTSTASAGHQVVRLVRRTPAGPATSRSGTRTPARVDPDVIEAADVVVNLAGAPTAGNPHSKKWARELRESRVDHDPGAGRRRSRTAASKPAFLAGNGISWYGDHGGRGRSPRPPTAAATPC